MLKKKKYAKNQLDDQGPDWGDLKPVETEPAPVLKKTDKVIHFSPNLKFSREVHSFLSDQKKSQQQQQQQKRKKKANLSKRNSISSLFLTIVQKMRLFVFCLFDLPCLLLYFVLCRLFFSICP